MLRYALKTSLEDFLHTIFSLPVHVGLFLQYICTALHHSKGLQENFNATCQGQAFPFQMARSNKRT